MKNMKLFINWKDYDKNGKLISETEEEANSFVNAFLGGLLTQFGYLAVAGILDTAGVSRSMGTALGNVFRINAATEDATFGIVVGTGTTAVSTADYALETLIAHGTGAGQLAYSVVGIDTSITTAGSTKYFNISRTFTNSSGGNITINEVGIITSYGSYKYLIDHTLSTKLISNDNSSTCAYKFSVTV